MKNGHEHEDEHHDGEVGGGGWGEKTSGSLVGKRTVKGEQADRQRSPWSMDSYHHRAQLLSTAFQIPLMIARPRCQLTPPPPTPPRFNQPDLWDFLCAPSCHRMHKALRTVLQEAWLPGGSAEQETDPLLGDHRSVDTHVNTSRTHPLVLVYPIN